MVKKIKRPRPIQMDHGFFLRVARGPHKDNPKIWYWKLARWENGADVAHTCFWATMDVAIQKATALLSQETNPFQGAFGTLIEQWFNSQAFGKYSIFTQRQYKCNAKHLLAMFSEYPKDWETVAAKIPSLSVAHRTVKGILVCGGALHKWARAVSLVKGSSPFSGHDIPDESLRDKFTPSTEDVEKILNSLSGWHRLVVLILVNAGLRIGEVGRLTWEAFNFTSGTITIEGKARRQRIIPMAPKLRAELEPIKQSAGQILPVKNAASPEFYIALKEACEVNGLHHFTPHSFRRYLIDQFRIKGVQVQIAAKFFGHSPSVMMRIYETISSTEVMIAGKTVFGPDDETDE